MRFFRRRRAAPLPPQPAPPPVQAAPPPVQAAPVPPPPAPPPVQAAPPEPEGAEITVSRTLVLSEPEIAEVVACHPTLEGDSVRIALAEKGFGTRVTLTAPPESGINEETLSSYLDDLAEQRRRPFSNT